MIAVILAVLTALTVASAWIILRGPTAWDRLQGLSVFSSKVTLLIVLYALIARQSYILDIALVFSLLGFISLMLIARFIDRRGQV
jgi:multicomponent Na+:H+ antiporter subunit F